MAELQEVQITEEKPLLPGQTPETAKEAELAARILLDQGQTHSVETPYGSVTFTVYGTPKPKRPAIFTYHDVGLNCKTISFPTSFWGETGRGNPNVCVCVGEHSQYGQIGSPVAYQRERVSSSVDGIKARGWVLTQDALSF